MIVSHSHKFVFVKTLKVGGTSLEIALSKYCGAEDIIGPLEPSEEVYRRRVAKIGSQNHYRPSPYFGLPARLRQLVGKKRQQMRFFEHMPAWRIRREIGDELWQRYFTFTIVRNPFDRLVSRYYHAIENEKERNWVEQWDYGSFDQFIRYKVEMTTENWRMYTLKDVPIVDFCVRYEHLESDLAEVSKRIGLESNIHDDMKEIRMKADIRPGRAHYGAVVGPRSRDLISLLCAEEMRLFGYGFDDPEGRAEGARDAAAVI